MQNPCFVLPFRPCHLARLVGAALPWIALSGPVVHAEALDPATDLTLPPVVVTAAVTQSPTRSSIDPRAAQQPQPASDGASVLKAFPGMSVIRKGGIDGDPVFRGMAASRLNILADGEQLLGGCGMRMDPPTAYVFPDAYTRVTLIKGPQTVLNGPGASAGTVLFERSVPRFDEPGMAADAAVGGGSFGRWDAFVDGRVGNRQGHFQLQGSRAESGDYRDGNGRDVHSAYRRENAEASIGWRPDEDTLVELRAGSSRARAAYGDRSMDGARFDREHVGLKVARERLSPLVHQLEGQVFHNDIDHVMDNFSLRTPPANLAQWMASNPDRKTSGGRLSATLRPSDADKVVLGLDHQHNVHTVRGSGMGGETVSPYASRARVEDARFENLGIFGEWTRAQGNEQRLVSGLRADRWRAQDQRTTLTSGMTSLGANPTAGQVRNETLWSGFVRHEHDFGEHTEVHIGLGHVERAPDYWELISKESVASTSAFASTRREKTTQLDLGAVLRDGPWEAFVSGYAGRVDDYILIQSMTSKPGGMGPRNTTVARNIDAWTWGAEAGARRKLGEAWGVNGSLAWARGQNRTDDRPLGQMPALEARLGLNWESGAWSAGGLLRAVASQKRQALYQGNIVGQDLGPTAGFGVVSVHAGWRLDKRVIASVGIDNVFDKAYAEAINRAGATVAGYDTTTRVNEPGRAWWAKVRVSFE